MKKVETPNPGESDAERLVRLKSELIDILHEIGIVKHDIATREGVIYSIENAKRDSQDFFRQF